MMRALPISLLLVLAPAFASGQTAASPKARDAGTIYTANCAGCHGPNLEGGKGGSLIDAEWKHGSDEAAIMRSISQGFTQNGMPAFSATINEADTKDRESVV